jgi:hypothetical protein
MHDPTPETACKSRAGRMSTNSNPTVHERLALLEYQRGEDRKKLDEVNSKLDQLLELRAKGAGAFWLASALFGTGIVGSFSWLFGWIHLR